MMYNRDPFTPSELTDNQWVSNPVAHNLSGISIIINDYVSKIADIYHIHINASKNPHEHQKVTGNTGEVLQHMCRNNLADE